MKPSPRSDQVRALREAKFGGRKTKLSPSEVGAIADRAEASSKARATPFMHQNGRMAGPALQEPTDGAVIDSVLKMPKLYGSDLVPVPLTKEFKMPSVATKPKGFDKGLHSKLNMRLVRARTKGDADAIAVAEKDLRAAFPNAKPHNGGPRKVKAAPRKVAKAKKRAKR